MQPLEVDAKARYAWGQIYDGNINDSSKRVNDFMTKHKDETFKAPAAPIYDMNGPRLK